MATKLDKPKMISSAVMSFPQPPLKNAEEYLKAYTGYSFTAISSIAEEVASVDLNLYKLKFIKGQPKPELILQHEALSVLHYVNSLTTLYDMIETTQIYLELTGEAFWVILKQNQKPREMWLLRPDWVKIVPDPKEIIRHYTYHPGGRFNEKVIIPRENMIHFKNFHPLNPYRGKGSVQAAALPLDIHTFAQEYNRNFFFNSAIPSLVFTTDKKLSEKAIKRFVNQWQASYGGRSKSNKIAFLGGGLKLDKVSQGAKELDFATQQRMMRDDILAVFKVPKSILGLTEDVNRANAEATNRAFMERVITPRMRKFVGHLNEFYLPMFGDNSLFFDFTDPAPEDVELKLKKYENALKYGWMTPNEVRQAENLEPLEGGDVLMPLNQFGKPSVAPSPPEEEEGKGILSRVFSKKEIKQVKKVKPKKKVKKIKHKWMVGRPTKRLEDIEREDLEKKLTKELTRFIGDFLEAKRNGEKKQKTRLKTKKQEPDELFSEEAKDAYWRTFINIVTEREEELKAKAIELFKQQEKDVIFNLDNTVRYWRKHTRKGKESSVLPSLEDMKKIWNVVFIETIREIVYEQGAYVLDFLGVGGNLNMSTDEAVEYIREHGAELITQINKTTRNKLRETLAEGFDLGESIADLIKRVKDVFKEATRNRAEMIARTESIRASNFGTLEAYRQSGVVEAQQWLAERDDRTCSFCEEMDGKVIGLNEKFFEKGDSLTVDGDTLKFDLLAVEYPPLHVNCRCTTIPVLIGEKIFREKEWQQKKIEVRKRELKRKQRIIKKKKLREQAIKQQIKKIVKEIEEQKKQFLEKEKALLTRERNQVIKKAKRKAEKIIQDVEIESKAKLKDVEKLINEKEKLSETQYKKLIEEAQKKAHKLLSDAESQYCQIIEKAKIQASKEKKTILSELKRLRDKAREAIYGRKQS